jgi:hypothetical protein
VLCYCSLSEKVIKKHHSKNKYLLCDSGVWVRDFTQSAAPYLDLNKFGRSDSHLLLENELDNIRMKLPDVEAETNRSKRSIVIVSDGYGFADKHKLLESLPKEVCLIAVNKSVVKWTSDRLPNYYLVNNPFPECMYFLPESRNPMKCIASVRTHPPFVRDWRGPVFFYSPVPNHDYVGPSFTHTYRIDDYRNPVCAAIGVAYRFGADRIMLLCCDDSFEGERPGAVKLDNGLFSYPPQLLSQKIIDGNLHWLKTRRVKIANHSHGLNLENAEYISVEGVRDFFGKKL